MKLSNERKILLISLAVAGSLIPIGIISGDPGILGNSMILSTFVVAAPQLLLRYKKYRELKEIEEKFPDFLRDMIESLRSGVPFHKAIIDSSRVEYGELSKEVKKMADQLSWGVPLDKVLNMFAERVKRSRRLFTSVKIIRESHLSGGDVVSTLESVAENSIMLEESQKEKRSLLNQYVVIMYAISLIFIAIVAAINNLMIPIFKIPTGGGGGGAFGLGLTNPCDACGGFGCNICDLFEQTAVNLFSIEPGTIGSYYTSLFFFMSLIQSIFSGLVAGQISENSIMAGAKHSLILSGITIGAFSILVRLGFLGV